MFLQDPRLMISFLLLLSTGNRHKALRVIFNFTSSKNASVSGTLTKKEIKFFFFPILQWITRQRVCRQAVNFLHGHPPGTTPVRHQQPHSSGWPRITFYTHSFLCFFLFSSQANPSILHENTFCMRQIISVIEHNAMEICSEWVFFSKLFDCFVRRKNWNHCLGKQKNLSVFQIEAFPSWRWARKL